MKACSSARAVTAALAATVLVALAGAVLTGLGWSHLATSDAVGSVDATASAIAYAGLGALIVRRAGNLIGWFMLAEGAAIAIGSAGSAYAIVGMKAHPGTLPSPATVGALAESVFVIESNVLAAIFLVFPTGRLPSPRWRPAALAGLVLTGLRLAAFVVSTRQVALPAPGGISLTYPNPLAVRSVDPAARLGTLNGLAVLFLLLLAPAVVSLVIRYRRGDQRLRQQMKWLALVVAGVLVCQAVGILAIAVGQQDKPLQAVPYAITPFLVTLGIPAAMAIAILRRRLFDIDVIISRALLFTLLSAGVTAVYAAIVLGIGTFVGHRSDPLLTIAAAVVIALVFQPLRQRASLLANRLVYGHRATPYQVLSDFAADMAGQLDLGGALDRMVSLLAGAAGASRVEAWIRVGAELRPGAVWPGGSAPSAAVELNGAAAGLPVLDPWARVVPVRHGDDLLGAISLSKPRERGADQHRGQPAAAPGLPGQPGHAQRPADRRAAGHDRRAARVPAPAGRGPGRRTPPDRAEPARRRPAAADRAGHPARPASRIGRRSGADPAGHPRPEGAAQHRAGRPARAGPRHLPAAAGRTRPGHGAAHAGRPQPGAGRPRGRPGRPVPAGRREHRLLLHAGGAAERGQARPGLAATVRLSGSGDTLEFSVSDDGAGFPAAATSHGSGLQGMSDRLAAHGGTLTVRSQPGQGTTITGRLPVRSGSRLRRRRSR